MLKKLILFFCCLTSAYADISDQPDCNLPPASKVNWARCNKSNINLSGYYLQLSDFSSANFKNTTFRNTNLSGSILTGANIEGVDFSTTKLDGVMWIDGKLCSTIKSECQNRLPLNDGYQLLKELLAMPNTGEEIKEYYRRLLRSSITYNIDKFTFSYKVAKDSFAGITEQDQDPILNQPFNDNDQVIILKTTSGRYNVFYNVFLKDSFLNWINTPLCNFSNPLTKEALNFLINN